MSKKYTPYSTIDMNFWTNHNTQDKLIIDFPYSDCLMHTEQKNAYLNFFFNFITCKIHKNLTWKNSAGVNTILVEAT